MTGGGGLGMSGETRLVIDLLRVQNEDLKDHVSKECEKISKRLYEHVEEDKVVHKQVEFHSSILRLVAWGLPVAVPIAALIYAAWH